MFEGHSVFHQSYHEHSCIVFSEKDVLYTDVKGKVSAFRRWWHNLFLLSYFDPRCHIYYNSSQVMRLERSRHFRKYQSRIHPLSIFTTYWDIFISIVFAYNRVFFSMSTSIILHKQPLWMYYVSMFLEFILLFDIYISYKTGFIDKEARRIILNRGRGYLRFSSSKLFLHSLSVLPLQNTMFQRYGIEINCVLCKSNRFVCTLNLFSVLGLYRIFDSTATWIKDGQSFKTTYILRYIRILVIGLVLMTQYHYLTQTIELFVIFEDKVIKDSALAYRLQLKYWTPLMPENFFMIMEVSKIVKSLFLFGYGLKPRSYYLDSLFGQIGFIIAILFFLWFMVDVMAVVQRSTYSQDQISIHMDRNINMMRCQQLSDKINAKVMDYYHFSISKLVVIEKVNDLYQSLPTSIINELKLACYSKLMKAIPYFEGWPSNVIADLVLLLNENMYLPNDVVADSWTQGDGLVIIHKGVLAVYTADQTESGHLIDGDYFGELSLVTDRELRTSFVLATVSCMTLLLEKNEFRRYMRKSPQLFFEMRSKLIKKYSNIDENEDR